MPSIPWDVIGAGGGFAILVLTVVFVFLIKWKKSMTEELKKESRKPCVESEKVIESFQRNIQTAKTVDGIHKEMVDQTKELLKHTILLKIMARRANGGVFDPDDVID